MIITILAVLSPGFAYIAFWRPAQCRSTALISSGRSPGPSLHCWTAGTTELIRPDHKDAW